MPTVCLVMMVKNESKIIERCLASCVGYVDSYCITDTGSTDNTIEKIKNFMKKHKIPGEVHEEKWVNFGVSRTKTVQNAHKKADYLLLLDADFVMTFKRKDWRDRLKNDPDQAYYLYYDGRLRYKIMYLVTGHRHWRYRGVTHEFIAPDEWEGMKAEDNNDVTINHVGDGGCKDNKFARDIFLLEQGIKDEPKNERYFFYLANSYFDINRRFTAKYWYKRRVEAGGWHEEVYYAMYRYGLCVLEVEGVKAGVQELVKAWEFRPSRLEALYRAVRILRDLNPKLGYCYAMMAYPACLRFPTDGLFVEADIHNFYFLDELAICAFYAGNFLLSIELNSYLIEKTEHPNKDQLINNRKFSLKAISLKKFSISGSKAVASFPGVDLNNAKKIKAVKTYSLDNKKTFEIAGLENQKFDHTKFVSSTPSVIKYKSGYVCNIRYVNYHYDVVHKHGWHAYPLASTINERVEFDSEFRVKSRKFLDIPDKITTWTGIEDIRLYEYDNEILFYSNTSPPSRKVGHGKYESDKISSYKELNNIQQCDKNWVYLPPDAVVYSFYPLILGKVVNKNFHEFSVEIVESLSGCRGGSNGVVIGDEIWFVAHLVDKLSTTRRVYAHKMVALERRTYKVKWVTKPFKLSDHRIEFCASLVDMGDSVMIGYSGDDRTTNLSIYNKSQIRDLRE